MGITNKTMKNYMKHIALGAVIATGNASRLNARQDDPKADVCPPHVVDKATHFPMPKGKGKSKSKKKAHKPKYTDELLELGQYYYKEGASWYYDVYYDGQVHPGVGGET